MEVPLSSTKRRFCSMSSLENETKDVAPEINEIFASDKDIVCAFRMVWKPQVIDAWTETIKTPVKNDASEPFLFSKNQKNNVARVLVGQMAPLAVEVSFGDLVVESWKIIKCGYEQGLPCPYIVFEIKKNNVLVRVPWKLQIVQRAFHVTEEKKAEWKPFLDQVEFTCVYADTQSQECEIQVPVLSYSCRFSGCICQGGERGPLELISENGIQYADEKKTKVIVRFQCNEVSTHRGANPDSCRSPVAIKYGPVFPSLFWLQARTFDYMVAWDDNGPFISLEKFGEKYRSLLAENRASYLLGRRPHPAIIPQNTFIFKPTEKNNSFSSSSSSSSFSCSSEVSKLFRSAIPDEDCIVKEKEKEKPFVCMQQKEKESPVSTDGIFFDAFLKVYDSSVKKWVSPKTEENIMVRNGECPVVIDIQFARKSKKNTPYPIFNIPLVENVMINSFLEVVHNNEIRVSFSFNRGSQISDDYGVKLYFVSRQGSTSPVSVSICREHMILVDDFTLRIPVNMRSFLEAKHAFSNQFVIVMVELKNCKTQKGHTKWAEQSLLAHPDVSSEKYTFSPRTWDLDYPKNILGCVEKLIQTNSIDNNNNNEEDTLWGKIIDAIDNEKNVLENRSVDSLMAQRDVLLSVAKRYRKLYLEHLPTAVVSGDSCRAAP